MNKQELIAAVKNASRITHFASDGVIDTDEVLGLISQLPDGVVVPVEPTEEMLLEGINELNRHMGPNLSTMTLALVFKAMLKRVDK